MNTLFKKRILWTHPKNEKIVILGIKIQTNTLSKCIEKRSWHKNGANMDREVRFFKKNNLKRLILNHFTGIRE